MPQPRPEVRKGPDPEPFFDSTATWFWFIQQLEEKRRYMSEGRALDEIRDVCQRHRLDVPAGTAFFRARTLPAQLRFATPIAYTVEEMWAPVPSAASGGRLNPAGIPYLYVAEDSETAVAEARAWRDAFVTVATFHTVRPVTIFDFNGVNVPRNPANFLFHKLAEAFATPTHSSIQHAYAATQFIAEYMKAVGGPGVAGVRYPSARQPSGVNVAFFGGAALSYSELLAGTSTELRRVTRIVVESEVV